MSLKDGGPAFPALTEIEYRETDDCGRECYTGKRGVCESSGGMSLRDYFAAAALQGLAQRHPHTGTAGMIVSTAYILADAMLAQRDVIDPSFEVKA